ncbi:MAG TPA: four helix bundle protein [Gemmatimonadaceae bacterium]|nr:four helix bundle protein [Gemmatimonadaceae bacterium]
MTYDEWEATVPREVKGDRIWHVQAYRLALYLADVAELDTRFAADEARFVGNAAQLVKAAGSVAAGLAEGYPRRSGKDRAKFYEYALTSLTETKSWYIGMRSRIPAPIMTERFATMESIKRLTLTMIRSARANGASELDPKSPRHAPSDPPLS